MASTSSDSGRDLQCHGRAACPPESFGPEDKLYRGFSADECDAIGRLRIDALVFFPDVSCNWSRFSDPIYVRVRLSDGSTANDGCYSLSVSEARYMGCAAVVHDPLCSCPAVLQVVENYSHCEIRELYPGEIVPPWPEKNRPKRSNKESKKRRLAWRKNLEQKHQVELPPVVP
jgi:hypothetical protein